MIKNSGGRKLLQGCSMKIIGRKFPMNKTIPNVPYKMTLIIVSVISVILYSFNTMAAEIMNKQWQAIEQDGKYELKIDPYIFQYESVDVVKKSKPNIRPLRNGKITIKKKERDIERVIYEEYTEASPRAQGMFPALSKMPVMFPEDRIQLPKLSNGRWFVIFYGDNGGRSNTMKIFFTHGTSLLSATLELTDTSPNISDIDGDGIYEVKVFRRLLIGDTYATTYYLIIYKLFCDFATCGFVPTFDKNLSPIYNEYYETLKEGVMKNAPDGDEMGPMLASVLSTRDEKKISSEIKYLKDMFKLNKDDMIKWGKKLKGLGYPGTDFQKYLGGNEK